METGKEKQFLLVHNGALSSPYTLGDLVKQGPSLYRTFLIQSLGFPDAHGQDLYEGDVLEISMGQLPKSLHAYLGLDGRPRFCSLFCALEAGLDHRGCRYGLYVLELDGTLTKWHAAGHSVPDILCRNGAVYVGNRVQSPDLLERATDVSVCWPKGQCRKYLVIRRQGEESPRCGEIFSFLGPDACKSIRPFRADHDIREITGTYASLLRDVSISETMMGYAAFQVREGCGEPIPDGGDPGTILVLLRGKDGQIHALSFCRFLAGADPAVGYVMDGVGWRVCP